MGKQPENWGDTNVSTSRPADHDPHRRRRRQAKQIDGNTR
jgi:hypothetical protein